MPHIKTLLGGAEARLDHDLVVSCSQGRLTVTFENGRSQVIRYRREGDFYLFVSSVARPQAVKKIRLKHLAQRILARNRATEVVTFGLSPRNGIDAWVSHRADTLQPEELKFYLKVLAREADRFEYLLTGKDVY